MSDLNNILSIFESKFSSIKNKDDLQNLKSEFFEVDKIKMRFRPSHFPFTEPSAEVDIGYRIESNKIIIIIFNVRSFFYTKSDF